MPKGKIYKELPLLTEFPSRAQWESAVWEILIERLAGLGSPIDIRDEMNFLLTPTERRFIIRRALGASRIESGIGPSEIQREVWLSRQTISAIKKSLKEGEFKSSRTRGHKEKKYSPIPGKEQRRPKQQNPLRQRWIA